MKHYTRIVLLTSALFYLFGFTEQTQAKGISVTDSVGVGTQLSSLKGGIFSTFLQQDLATFHGAADNHTIEVIVNDEVMVLQVNYDQATRYDVYMGQLKTIVWLALPNGQNWLLQVR